MIVPISRRDLLKGTGSTLAGVGLVGGLSRSGLERVLAGASAVDRDVPALSRVRIGAVSGRQAELLARLDDTHGVLADGSREFLLWPGDADRLRRAGIRFDVVTDDVLAPRRLGAQVPLQPGEREGYRVLADYEADLRALADAHPDLARFVEMPTTSLLGRPLFAIEIASDVARRDGRPVVHMDGMHHCREWPAGEMPIMWAHDLLENYGTDPAITRIVDATRTVILPLVNPDGFERTVRSLAQADESSGTTQALATTALAVAGRESYWRKNLRGYLPVDASVDAGPVLVEKPDAYGIDLNRNYPFLWGDDEGSSSTMEDQTYRGEAPYSEPESHNVRDLVLANLPIAKITHHTSGRTMLFPWGRDPNVVKSPDYDRMYGLGLMMRMSNNYEPKQAFGLYPTSGTSRDWGHGAIRTLPYTFEHGTEFHGPYAQTIPSMYAVNRGAFLTLYDAVMDPASHLVVRGSAPDAAPFTVTKSFATPTAVAGLEVPETAERTVEPGPDGSFELHLPPPTRPHLFETTFGGTGTAPAADEVWTLRFADGSVREVGGDRGEVVDLG